jgi:hypothetical protein
VVVAVHFRGEGVMVRNRAEQWCFGWRLVVVQCIWRKGMVAIRLSGPANRPKGQAIGPAVEEIKGKMILGHKEKLGQNDKLNREDWKTSFFKFDSRI